MTTQMTLDATAAPPRRLLRSAAALLAGLIAVFALSLGIDQLLHVLEVYAPWSEPMQDHGLNLLALSYRIPIGVLGSYLAAALAPHAPMRHAMILGSIDLVLSTAGAIAAISKDAGRAGIRSRP